ncbi:hypothetical protein HJC23_005036 [Cyclotella cryptica]|uniref:Seipin n=1 Tax=Cyclotella cryptica TaxID=29204 RepID=A0ABD3QDB4_9STRA|eukprot:CCRYP_006252-RA/>CCRYP_006252-RA protein AED:0.29 eAED:0.29 QI:2232/1/1/1/0.66/0.25/4/524/526
MAHSTEDSGTWRQPLERAIMLMKFKRFASSHDEPPSSCRSEEPLQNLILRNIIPFFFFFAKLLASLIGVAVFSVVTYWFIYSSVVMRGLEVQSRPIFFDYSAGDFSTPLGRVDLMSTMNAPWLYVCGNSDSNSSHNSGPNFCIQDHNRLNTEKSDNSHCHTDVKSSYSNVNPELMPYHSDESQHSKSNHVLKTGQKYFIEVVLTLPESDVNRKLGMFMLIVDLRSSDGSLLAKSKQSSLFPYESGVVGLARKLILLLPLVSGVMTETKTISLLCFDNYVDSSKSKSLSYAEVTLDVPHLARYPAPTHTIQVISADFHYGRMMSPLQRFFRSWFYFCAFFGVLLIFICYGVLGLYLASARGWLLNRDTYRYPAFADAFDSNNSSMYNFSAGSQLNSFSGVDVEFLDDEDNNDAWEPLNGTEARDTDKSNVILDDKSIASSCCIKLQSNEPLSKTCHLGPLTVSPTIQDQKSKLFSRDDEPNNTDTQTVLKETALAKQEEKCLADMVMKGLSKWEVFTDQDDPDDTVS